MGKCLEYQTTSRPSRLDSARRQVKQYLPRICHDFLLTPVFWIEDGLRQVAELLRRKAVPFDIGNHSPLSVDECGVERVVQQAFIRKEVHSEEVTHPLHVTGLPGEKVPGRRIGIPPAGILRQNLRRIVGGVK